MANRRRFLQAAATVTLVPITDLIGFSKTNALNFSEIELNDFVYDERLVEQNVLSTFDFKEDVLIHSINGDLTQLWSSYLNQSWKKSPKPIAGITTAEDLFYLERLAWTHGLRVSLRDKSEATIVIDEKPKKINVVAWILEPTIRT